MVVFNPQKKEIDIKVVYYGPALCGKTTNLKSVHLNLNPQQRGELISLATKDDRTLFFDFLPIQLDNIKGFKTRFHIYTVPGQVFYTLTRKAVLTGVDGVIFVADSQNGKMKENIESLNDLKDNLKYYNKTLDSIPLVMQYNKRDLPDLIPIAEMNDQLNTMRAPYFEACALSGKGVMETLTMCCKLVLKQMQNRSKTDRLFNRVPLEKSTAQSADELPQLTLPQNDHVIAEAVAEPPPGKIAEPPSTDAITSDGLGLPTTATAPEPHDSESRPTPEVDERGRGMHFQNERSAEEDKVRLPVAAEKDAVSYEAKNESGKRMCPRCSLKFKPNVRQCPICRISLVPEEQEVILTGDRTPAADLQLQYPADDLSGCVPESVAPGKMSDNIPDGQPVEIVSCEQPLMVSSNAITIPLLMRIRETNSTVKVELTLTITNANHHQS